VAKQPMAEVFGFPIDNQSDDARRYRNNKLCPFNNYIPNCTKDKANAPLGVCSVNHSSGPVITCPVRFREQWIIAEDAAGFFFPQKTQWTAVSEVKLKDLHGKSAGNIDLVLVSYDSDGRLVDFGALEVQAVYISGNIRVPFEVFIDDPDSHANLDWARMPKYPKPDFLSSSRKRLAPQLLFKGGILNHWKKKSAVALDLAFFKTLPELDEVDPSNAEMAWFVYDLVHDKIANKYSLARVKSVYTKFSESLTQITVARPGKVEDFIKVLQEKLDRKRSTKTPPSNLRLDEMF
jgi:Restriction endonuclease NotI